MARFEKCRKCRNEVHPDWKKCVHCGHGLYVQRMMRMNSVLKVMAIVAIVFVFFYLPRQGYEIYARQAAIVKIMQKTKPIQEYYESNGRMPAVPGEININMSGLYQSAGDDDGIGIFRFNWLVNLEESMIVIDIGPGFHESHKYSIILKPVSKDGNIVWDCAGGSLPRRYRSPSCQKP